jgi:small subunit ribosomal protein S20
MANTKSAERRMRQGVRRHAHNQSIKHTLKSLERSYLDAAEAGKKEEAAKLYRTVSSAFDRAAKVGVIHPSKASRKKSRLAAHL